MPASGVIAVSAPLSRKVAERQAERVGGDLRDDRVGALADIDRALVQHDRRRRREMPSLMVEGLGSEVLPQPYQQEATPTPRLHCSLLSR